MAQRIDPRRFGPSHAFDRQGPGADREAGRRRRGREWRGQDARIETPAAARSMSPAASAARRLHPPGPDLRPAAWLEPDFVVPGDGGRGGFVHAGVPVRSGMTGPAPGRRISSAPKAFPANSGRRVADRRGGGPDCGDAGGFRRHGLPVAHAGRREDRPGRNPPGFGRGSGVSTGRGVPAAGRARGHAPPARPDGGRRGYTAGARRFDLQDPGGGCVSAGASSNDAVGALSRMFNRAGARGMVPPGSSPCRQMRRYRTRRLERFLKQQGGEPDGIEPLEARALQGAVIQVESVDIDARSHDRPPRKKQGPLRGTALEPTARCQRVSDRNLTPSGRAFKNIPDSRARPDTATAPCRGRDPSARGPAPSRAPATCPCRAIRPRPVLRWRSGQRGGSQDPGGGERRGGRAVADVQPGRGAGHGAAGQQSLPPDAALPDAASRALPEAAGRRAGRDRAT